MTATPNTAAPTLPQFHLSKFGPTEPFPHGGWALYRITGDEIARRIGFNDHGDVTRREGWPGYIGCFSTLDDVLDAIEEGERA